MIIEGGEKITIESVQDDLNIIQEEILKNPNKIPSSKSLDQLEYDKLMLDELLGRNNEDPNDSKIVNMTNLIERILRTYRVEKSPIRISREKKNRLKEIGSDYENALGILLDFWDEKHKM